MLIQKKIMAFEVQQSTINDDKRKGEKKCYMVLDMPMKL